MAAEPGLFGLVCCVGLTAKMMKHGALSTLVNGSCIPRVNWMDSRQRPTGPMNRDELDAHRRTNADSLVRFSCLTNDD